MRCDLGAAQRDHLARLHLVDLDAAERGERAGLAGHGVPTMGETADRQRTEAPRIADGDDLVGGEDHEGERSLPGRQRALDAVLPRLAAGGREHQRQHFGVARRGEAEAPIEQLVAQRCGVHQVAVVGEGERAVHRLDQERLDVALGVRSGRRVTGVADRVVADERLEGVRREHVGDESGLLVDPHPAPVAHGDPGRFLTAMLEREQSEERQLRDTVTVGRRDAEHTALVLRGVVGIDVGTDVGGGVRQARHGQPLRQSFRHE